MPKNTHKRVIWRCPLCNNNVESTSIIKQGINYCQCRKFGLDLGRHYARWIVPEGYSPADVLVIKNDYDV